MVSRGVLLLVLLGLACGFASPAEACSVCFGETESPMARGAEMSILFMAVLTYLVIFGGAAFFVALRIRARRADLEPSSPS